jgi:hypothetical protein
MRLRFNFGIEISDPTPSPPEIFIIAPGPPISGSFENPSSVNSLSYYSSSIVAYSVYVSVFFKNFRNVLSR